MCVFQSLKEDTDEQLQLLLELSKWHSNFINVHQYIEEREVFKRRADEASAMVGNYKAVTVAVLLLPPSNLSIITVECLHVCFFPSVVGTS